MKVKEFYRVGNLNSRQGLWYDMDGNFTGLIHGKYNFCKNNHIQMPYNKEVVGYLSACETIEQLKVWFDDEDIARLKPFGYWIMKYESSYYKKYNGHYLINQISSRLIDLVRN
jgi:hypothetical protein